MPARLSHWRAAADLSRVLARKQKQKRLPSYSVNTNMLPLIGQSTKLLDAMIATTIACLGRAASKSLLVLEKLQMPACLSHWRAAADLGAVLERKLHRSDFQAFRIR